MAPHRCHIRKQVQGKGFNFWNLLANNLQALNYYMPNSYRQIEMKHDSLMHPWTMCSYFMVSYRHSGDVSMIDSPYVFSILTQSSQSKVLYQSINNVAISTGPSGVYRVDKWEFFCANYNPNTNTAKFVFNQNPISQFTHASSPRERPQTQSLNLGPGSRVHIYLKLFALFNEDLSASEMGLLYYQPFGIRTSKSKLMIYYNFRQTNQLINMKLESNYYMMNIQSTNSYFYSQRATVIDALDGGDVEVDKIGQTAVKVTGQELLNLPLGSNRYGVRSHTTEVWINMITTPSTGSDSTFVLLYIQKSNNPAGILVRLVQDYITNGNQCRMKFNQAHGNDQHLTYGCTTMHRVWKHYVHSYTHVGQIAYMMEQAQYYQVSATANNIGHTIDAVQIGASGNPATGTGEYLLRELRIWNVYRTPTDVQRHEHHSLYNINHVNIMQYYTLSAEMGVYTMIMNYAGSHGYDALPYLITPREIMDANYPLTLCKSNQRFIGSDSTCSNSEDYMTGIKYAKDVGVSYNWVIPSTVSFVIDYWVYIERTSATTSPVMLTNVPSVDIQMDNAYQMQCRVATTIYTTLPGSGNNKWFHIAIKGIGKQDLYMYLDGHECSRNPASLTATGTLNLYLAPSTHPSTGYYIIKELKRWASQDYIEYALSMANSTIYDPYDIPYLLEYYQMSGQNMHFKANNNYEVFMESKKSTPAYFTYDLSGMVNSRFDHHKVTPLIHQCHLGMFKAPFPTYHRCVLPNPVLKYHDFQGTLAQIPSYQHQIAEIDVSDVDSNNLNMGFWWSFYHAYSDTKFDEMVSSKSNNDLRAAFEQISGRHRVHFIYQDFGVVFDLQTLLQPRIWVYMDFNVDNLANVFRLSMYSPHTFFTQKSKLVNKVFSGYSTNPLILTLGTNQYKQSASYHQYHMIRNFIYIHKTLTQQFTRAMVMSETHIHEAGRHSGLHFNSITHKEQLQILNYRDIQTDKLQVEHASWSVDQTFWHRICDTRFGSSDYLSTCGEHGVLHVQSEHYTEQIPSGSLYHNIRNGGNTYEAAQDMSVLCWVKPSTQLYNITTLMFGVGTLKQATHGTNGFHWGLSMHQRYKYQEYNNVQLLLYLKSSTTFLPRQMGIELSYSYFLGRWSHYTLVKIGLTKYQLYFQGALFGELSDSSFPTGNFYHSYQFGVLDDLSTNTVDRAFKGVYRDFAVFNSVFVPGVKEIYEGYGFLSTNCLYFNPFNSITSGQFPYMDIPLIDEQIRFTRNTYTDTSILNYYHGNAMLSKSLSSPYSKDNLNYPYKNPVNLVFTFPTSTPIAKFKNKGAHMDDYTISGYFYAGTTVNTHAVFKLTGMGQVNIFRSLDRKVEIEIYPNHKEKSKLINVYSYNQWNSLIIFLSSTIPTRRNLYVNGVRYIPNFLSSTASLASIIYPKNEVRYLHCDGYSSLNNVGIWHENPSDKVNYFPSRYLQMMNNKLDPLYYQPELKFYAIVENFHPIYGQSAQVKYSYWDYDRYVYPTDAAKQYLSITSAKGGPSIYYCNSHQQYFDGMQCQNTSVIAIVSNPQDAKQQRSQGLSLPISSTISNMNEYTLELWYISNQLTNTPPNIELYYWNTRSFESTQVKIDSNGQVKYLVETHVNNIHQDQIYLQSQWTHLMFRYKASNILQLYTQTQQVFSGAISSVSSWNNFEPIIYIGHSSGRTFAVQHIKLWSDVSFTYKDILEAHNDRGMNGMINHWPLTKRWDINTNTISDLITKQARQIYGFSWQDPSYITGRQTEALSMCKGDYKFIQKWNICMHMDFIEYEFTLSSSPVTLTPKIQNSGAHEWTVEFWFKVYYEDPASSLPFYIINTDWPAWKGLYYDKPSTPQLGNKFDLKQYEVDVVADHIDHWVYQVIKRKSNPGKLFLYLNNFKYDISDLYTTTNQILPKQIQLKFGSITSGTNKWVTIGIKEFTIWSESLYDREIYRKQSRSFTMHEPNLEVYIKLDQDELLQLGNPFLTQPDVKIDLETHTQTVVQNLYPAKVNNQHCIQSGVAYRTYYCQTPTNQFTNYQTQPAIPIELDPYIKDILDNGEIQFSIWFYYRIRTYPPTGESRKLFQYENMFYMEVFDNTDILFRFIKKDGTFIDNTVSGITSIQYINIDINFQEMISISFINQPSKNIQLQPLSSDVIPALTTHRLLLGDTNSYKYFSFMNMNIFKQKPMDNLLTQYTQELRETFLPDEAGLHYGLFYEYNNQVGNLTQYWDTSETLSVVKFPTQHAYGWLSIAQCPPHLVHSTIQKNCIPQQALRMAGVTRLSMNINQVKLKNELTLYFWFRAVEFASNSFLVLFNPIVVVELNRLAGKDNFYYRMYSCPGGPQGKPGKFEQNMKSGSEWMQIAIIDYVNPTQNYESYFRMLVNAKLDATQSPQKACVQDLSTITTSQTLQIGPSTTGNIFDLTRIMIFQDALSVSELSHLLYGDIPYMDYHKSLRIYYKLNTKQSTQYQLISDTERTSIGQPATPLNDKYIQFIDGPNLPLNGLNSFKGNYYRTDKYLFFPKHGHDTNRVIMPVSSQFNDGFTFTFCAFLKYDSDGFKGHFLDIGGLVNFYHIQESSTQSKLGMDSDSFVGGKHVDEMHKVKYDKWFCGAMGVKTTTNPGYVGSELYITNDQYGIIKTKKTVIKQGETLIISSFTTSFTKIYIGSHQQGSLYQCNCMLSEVKVLNSYIHNQDAYLHIMRHHTNDHDYPLILYAKLNEGGTSLVYNLVNAMPVSFDQGATYSQPYWMKAPSKLVICHHDATYQKSNYATEGICSIKHKLGKIRSKFEFNVVDTGFEVTVGFWYYAKNRATDMVIELANRISYIFHTGNQIDFKFHPSGYPLRTPQQLQGYNYNQWHYLSFKHSKQTEIVESYTKSSQISTWDSVKVNNINLPFSLSTPSVQNVKLLTLVNTNDEVFIVDVVYYKAALPEQTIAFRYGMNLDSSQMPALLAYYMLNEGVRGNPINSAAYATEYFTSETQPFEWYHHKTITGTYARRHHCFRSKYLLISGTDQCTRQGYDCQQCNEPKGFNYCIGDPSVTSNCLSQPPGTAYDPELKEYLGCHPLCTTCTTPVYNQNCTGCVTPLQPKPPSGTCTYFCGQGKALNTLTTPISCTSCTLTTCNCGTNDFASCLSCLTTQTNLKYIISGGVSSSPYCDLNCGTGKYYEQGTFMCNPCHETCQECSGSTGKECTVCKNQTHFKLSDPAGGECQQVKCGESEYKVGLKCHPCHYKCRTCTGGLETQCLSCKGSNSFLYASNSTCLDCTAKYPPNLFLRPNQVNCEQVCNGGKFRLDSLPYVLNPPGYCSDGNLLDGDGCSQVCQVEFGFKCEGGNLTTPDTCKDILQPVIAYKETVKTTKTYAVYHKFSEPVKLNNTLIKKGTHIKAFIRGSKSPYIYTWKVSIHSNDTIKYLIVPENNMILGEKFIVQYLRKEDIKDFAGNPLSNGDVANTLPPFSFISEEDSQRSESGGNAALYASLITIGCNLGVNIIMGGAMSKAWDFINAIQIIYYMPLIDINYPKLVKKTLSYFQFALADFELPVEAPNIVLDYMIKPEKLNDSPLNENFNEFGIESRLLLKLYSTKLLFWTLLLLIYPITLALLFIIKKLPSHWILAKIKYKLTGVEQSYRYNGIIRIVMELYLEMTLFAYVNLYGLQYQNYSQFAASIFCLITLSIVTLTPSFFSHIVSKNTSRAQTPEFEQQFGAITEGMKHHNNNMILLHWASIFLFRRLMYVIILIFLIEWPTMQMVACVLKNTVLLFLMYMLRPFASCVSLMQNLFNEFFIWVVFIACCAFIGQELSDKVTNIIAYCILGGIVFFTGINVMLIVVEIVKQVVKGVYRCVVRFKSKGSGGVVGKVGRKVQPKQVQGDRQGEVVNTEQSLMTDVRMLKSHDSRPFEKVDQHNLRQNISNIPPPPKLEFYTHNSKFNYESQHYNHFHNDYGEFDPNMPPNLKAAQRLKYLKPRYGKKKRVKARPTPAIPDITKKSPHKAHHKREPTFELDEFINYEPAQVQYSSKHKTPLQKMTQ